MAYDWTEARVAQLTDWWTVQNYSINEIARRFGDGLTKNAVIGKINRLKLSGRRGASAPPVPKQKQRKPPAIVPTAILAAPPTAKPFLFGGTPTRAPTHVATTPARADSKPLLALGENDCRWPVGEGGEHRFCAEPVKSHYSYGAHGRYCARHTRESKQSTVQTVRNEHAAKQGKAA